MFLIVNNRGIRIQVLDSTKRREFKTLYKGKGYEMGIGASYSLKPKLKREIPICTIDTYIRTPFNGKIIMLVMNAATHN